MACAQTVDIGECNTSGTNTTSNQSNYVVQYPKPYRRTDGKWIAVGSLLGTIFGGIANQDIIEDAEDAERDWNRLTDSFKNKGQWLFNDHASKLTDCTDKLHEKLCHIADCGYTVDYEALGIRTRATAMAVTELERKRLCRITDRYKIGAMSDIYRNLLLGEQASVTAALTSAMETARKEAFELNYKLLMGITQQIEGDQIRRFETGGKFMQIAMQSYSLLASSYRETAKASMGDMAKLGALLAIILPLLLGSGGFFDPESECDDSSPAPTPTPETPEAETPTEGE